MKLKNILRIALFFNLLVVINYGAHAMSLNDVGKVCLFSKMSGVIKLDGIPIANVKLVRTIDRNKPIIDETITDENGYFEFPAIFERTITKLLPQEFVVGQEIMAYYDNREYQIWSGVKRRSEENAESRGQPLIVECELNSERYYKKVNNSPIFGLCKWDAEPDPKEDFF